MFKTISFSSILLIAIAFSFLFVSAQEQSVPTPTINVEKFILSNQGERVNFRVDADFEVGDIFELHLFKADGSSDKIGERVVGGSEAQHNFGYVATNFIDIPIGTSTLKVRVVRDGVEGEFAEAPFTKAEKETTEEIDPIEEVIEESKAEPVEETPEEEPVKQEVPVKVEPKKVEPQTGIIVRNIKIFGRNTLSYIFPPEGTIIQKPEEEVEEVKEELVQEVKEEVKPVEELEPVKTKEDLENELRSINQARRDLAQLLAQLDNNAKAREESLKNKGRGLIILKNSNTPEEVQYRNLAIRGLYGPRIAGDQPEVEIVDLTNLSSRRVQELEDGLNNFGGLPVAPSIGQDLASSQSQQLFGEIKPIYVGDLRLGDIHDQVYNLQIFLNRNGYIVALTGDGSFGNEVANFTLSTEVALKRFQKESGVLETGVFDAETARIIIKY